MLEGWLPHLNLIDITICAQWPSTHILKSKHNNIWRKIAPNKCLTPSVGRCYSFHENQRSRCVLKLMY